MLVKHYRQHPNSSDVDSSSIRYQYYEPEVYDEYVRENEQEGKQNNFVRMGLKTEVLYNPERDEHGRPTDLQPKADKVEPAKEPKAKSAPKKADKVEPAKAE